MLRSGETYFSDGLHQNYNKFRNTHPYAISFGSYTPEGMFPEYGRSQFDIVDFIPDADMKENKLTIEIEDDIYIIKTTYPLDTIKYVNKLAELSSLKDGLKEIQKLQKELGLD